MNTRLQSGRRPVIGICASFSVKEGKRVGTLELGEAYANAIEKAGGAPLLLPPTRSPLPARQMVARVDGLLVPGGPDISPSRYGRRKHPAHRPLHPRREAFWFQALAEAERRRIPVLGICLGCQVLNVGRGGTLVQDIPSQCQAPLQHAPGKDGKRALHSVAVTRGTLLASIVGTGTFEVNSSHHQAVERPGRRLRVSARSADSVIEALEDPAYPFYLAIQWHPEALTARAKHLAIFNAFVRAAARTAHNGGRR